MGIDFIGHLHPVQAYGGKCNFLFPMRLVGRRHFKFKKVGYMYGVKGVGLLFYLSRHE